METLPTSEELLASPFVLIGTKEELLAKVDAGAKRWGITRYTVRTAARPDVAELIAVLPNASSA